MDMTEILRPIKRFFNVKKHLDKYRLNNEAESSGKTSYVSAENYDTFSEACNELDRIKSEQTNITKRINELDDRLLSLSTEIIKESAKEGIVTEKNFAIWNKLGDIGKAATIAGGTFIGTSLILKGLIDSFKTTSKEKALNERFYERLLNEEYEERQYILSLLEDIDRTKEIESTSSVINLPSVENRLTPTQTQPVQRPAVSYDPPVAAPQAPVAAPTTAVPVEQQSISSVGNSAPQISFSRENFERKSFSLFKSSITDSALKALGLEKPAQILGPTVVTTILIHYIEQALSRIENMTIERLGTTGDKQ